MRRALADPVRGAPVAVWGRCSLDFFYQAAVVGYVLLQPHTHRYGTAQATVWGVSGYQSDTPKYHGEPIPRGDSECLQRPTETASAETDKEEQHHGGGHREEHEKTNTNTKTTLNTCCPPPRTPGLGLGPGSAPGRLLGAPPRDLLDGVAGRGETLKSADHRWR